MVYWKNLEKMVIEKSLIHSISNTQYGPENKRSEKSVNAVLPQKANRKMIAFFRPPPFILRLCASIA